MEPLITADLIFGVLWELYGWASCSCTDACQPWIFARHGPELRDGNISNMSWVLVGFFPVEEQERQERNRSRQPRKEVGEDSADLDFMLALSLQNEGQAPRVAEQDFWRSIWEADQSRGGPSTLNDIKGRFVSSTLPSLCSFLSLTLYNLCKIVSFSWVNLPFLFVPLLLPTFYFWKLSESYSEYLSLYPSSVSPILVLCIYLYICIFPPWTIWE